jgi:hypothetical protein
MSGHQLAQGVASLGRNGESMLVHMQPREVAGLQALAMQGGGSLTINPETGLPEAGWFGDILGAVAPIAIGAMLGPGGIAGANGLFGMGALGAGLGTGLLGYAITGDLGKGVMAGLGGYGGAGLGESLSSFGTVTPTTPVETIGRSGVANASSIPGTTGASMFTEGAKDVIANQIPYTGITGSTGQIGANMGLVNPVNATVGEAVGKTAIEQIPQTYGEKLAAGASKAIQHPMDFFGKTGPGTMMNAVTLASPLMAIQPPEYKAPEDTSYQMKYEGPYTAQDRSPRTFTEDELRANRAAGSPELSYFGNANPYPGFNKAPGYAQGGVTGNGVAGLYGTQDGTIAQNTLKESYGLGRLNTLAQSASTENAKVAGFDAGGYVPTMGGAPSYGVAPTDLSTVAAIPSAGGAEASTPSGLSSILGNAITDPMGRTTGASQGGMGGKGGMMGMMGKLAGQATTPQLTMQDYINAAQRTYNPAASVMTGTMPGAIEQAQFSNINPQQPVARAAGGGLKDGGFVVPADVVSHLGNGSTDAGLTALQKRHGAQPIKGAGDGMSDSIKTTINGKQPARVADGEAYIPPEQVKRSGGAKKFYAMMDKVRKERTGTKKQGKQINPNKYLMA